jgi:hypothetical protein
MYEMERNVRFHANPGINRAGKGIEWMDLGYFIYVHDHSRLFQECRWLCSCILKCSR